MDNHRPDLFAQLKSLLDSSFEDMRNANVFAYFCPTDAYETTLAVPASLNASVRTATSGQSLDDVVSAMISHHGAQPLLGDTRTIRMERERELHAADGSVVQHSVVYLTPIPGSQRRQALQLVAAFPRDPAESNTSENMQALRTLLDACVSTLQWLPPTTSHATEA